MADRCNIPLTVAEGNAVSLDIGENAVSLDIGAVAYPVYPDNYKGAYVVTPNESEQVLETGGLMASENITVKPIPDNYGKITWNGVFITVS